MPGRMKDADCNIAVADFIAVRKFAVGSKTGGAERIRTVAMNGKYGSGEFPKPCVAFDMVAVRMRVEYLADS